VAHERQGRHQPARQPPDLSAAPARGIHGQRSGSAARWLPGPVRRLVVEPDQHADASAGPCGSVARSG
jgi:hypothetical protein